MNESAEPRGPTVRDWRSWQSAAERRLRADRWLAAAFVVGIALAIATYVVLRRIGGEAGAWARLLMLLPVVAVPIVGVWVPRCFVRRRAARHVPRLDGAACPTCGRPLAEPAQRLDQADGAATMRCESCERRWPLEELRAAWLASASPPEVARHFVAEHMSLPDLAAPSPHMGVLRTIRHQPGFLLWLVFLVAVTSMSWGTGFSGTLVFVFLPFMMLGMMVIASGLRGRVGEAPHCATCGQPVTPEEERPTRCPECGANLRARGALVRGALVRRPAVALAGVCLIAVGAVLGLGPAAVSGGGRSAASWTPTALLIRCAARGGLIDHDTAQRELAARTLTPAEEVALATAYVDGIRVPSNARRVDTKYLLALEQQGRLPTDLRARWYRESVEVTLVAPRRAAAVEPMALSLDARRFAGRDLAWHPALAIGEVAVDGVVVAGARSVELVRADVLASRTPSSSHVGGKDSPLRIPAPPAGTHHVRVQVWTVIRPDPAEPCPIEWRDDGTPVLQSDTIFAEPTDLETKVRVEAK